MKYLEPAALRAFISRVDSSAGADSCWPWRGFLTDDGYGRFGHAGVGAHRVAYELMKQPIPEGLVIDHLCDNRRCVNPEHLKAVRQRENILRSPLSMPNRNAAKTHCPRNHEYTPENTRHSIGSNGSPRRECRTCIRERSAARRRAA
jgi:hypothetical protein